MAESKIIKYGFQDEVLRLSAQPGMTGEKIAEILTARLENRDSIGQSAVSRFLTKYRQERQEQTNIIVQEHIKNVIPKRLDQLDEINLFYYTQFKNQKNLEKPMFVDPEGKPIEFDLRSRDHAAWKLAELIFKLLQHTGGKEPDEREGDDKDDQAPVQTRSGIRGIVQQLRAAGVSGPGGKKEIAGVEGPAGVLPR